MHQLHLKYQNLHSFDSGRTEGSIRNEEREVTPSTCGKGTNYSEKRRGVWKFGIRKIMKNINVQTLCSYCLQFCECRISKLFINILYNFTPPEIRHSEIIKNIN